jgi:hypothetical protein
MWPDEAESKHPEAEVQRLCRKCSPPAVQKIVNLNMSGSR